MVLSDAQSGSADAGGIEVAPGVRVAEGSMRFQFSRSGGPGGQNVNKLNTRAELHVPIAALRGLSADAVQRLAAIAGKRLTQGGEIHITAETARSQEANRAAVLEKLRELLVRAMQRPKRRKRTVPSRRARERRLATKRKRAELKASRRGADLQ